MATSKTTLKKTGTVNVTTKAGKSYSFKFVTMAQIHEWLEENGLRYEATIKSVDGGDYMFITKIDEEGKKSEPMQEARIPRFAVKDPNDLSSIMQDYASILTSLRRYSLMMAYGLATEDNVTPPPDKPQKPESGRYGSPAGRLDFDEIEAKLATIENVSQVDAYWDQLESGGMSWRQKSSLESMFKKRREQIKAQK